eukprot:1161634-Pelagomonas_calceolata.AAC.2
MAGPFWCVRNVAAVEKGMCSQEFEAFKQCFYTKVAGCNEERCKIVGSVQAAEGYYRGCSSSSSSSSASVLQDRKTYTTCLNLWREENPTSFKTPGFKLIALRHVSNA